MKITQTIKLSATQTSERIFVYPQASDLTVVIRAAHERTQQLCAQIIARQLPSPAQLTVIHESPFSAAVNRTFKIGIDSQRPWLIAIDADIIPLDDVIIRIQEICGKMDPKAFVATPLFLCNAVGGLATRGLHCYNAKYIQEAYNLIGTLDQSLRPESRIHDAMVDRGYTRECYAKIFGLHEYEQFAKHVYIKAMLRSRKDEFRDLIKANLELRAPTHQDSQIALWGFEDSNIDTQANTDLPIEYDWNAHYPRFEQHMLENGWTEKPMINLKEINKLDDFVLKAINTHDYRNDHQTLPWIRDLLKFNQGAPHALNYVNTTPLLPKESL